MISFYSPNAFYVLLLLLIVYFISGAIKNYEGYFSKEMLKKIIVGKNTNKRRAVLLICSFILLVIALARPVIENKPIKVSQSNISMVVAFDISASMKCNDVYPNRLKFAKNKFNNILEYLKDGETPHTGGHKVGAIGFSSRSFLLAPITNDYGTLKYLVANLNQDSINVKGSSVLSALETTNELLKNQKQKALIIFSDGTDTKDFSKSIEYAKEHKIKVFVYTIATKKGGVIPTNDGEIQKDFDGNIVVTSLNEKIKELALKSDGAYLEFSSSANDISKFIDAIRVKFKDNKQEEIIINTNRELFYIPLVIALIFLLIAISSFNRGRR